MKSLCPATLKVGGGSGRLAGVCHQFLTHYESGLTFLFPLQLPLPHPIDDICAVCSAAAGLKLLHETIGLDPS